MECQKQKNLEICNCTYSGCPRKGICCECLQYHLKNKQLPACCFPADAEATFDRSFEKFAEAWELNK
ncbi:cytosolic protein [Candidatus Woesearchaeota archaeon]|jgi:hypothetical protein|nr:cytosolic protein [Candidatus Woesearchaeota archaeon]MBT5272252.1 cytosolic protein [Candidatus Woesearchaeota archaeon]MBT6041155.1 cytosolic protein [Candidatus Woesearchaeota archaeon]MBT6336524.1 cytosolic protein [Candidatus Woesearchaeota archaeon]MBT7927414.1 cytosolic protein [Candidatus Woesearchaeota archaeon]